MTAFRAADHRARFRGVWRVTVTCSCGWISENRPGRRSARDAYFAHVIIAGLPDAIERRRRRGLHPSGDPPRPIP